MIRRSASAVVASDAFEVISALHAAQSCGEAARNIAYWTNRVRTDYPRFRVQGLCVSTGFVEGGCKSLIGGRLERGGMHWGVVGAISFIARRCAVDSSRFDEQLGGHPPWERRAG